MAFLPIIIAPDPRLKKVSVPVEAVDDELRRLMDDMLETMYAAPGVGLAAPQVGVLKRVIVLDAGREDAGREDGSREDGAREGRRAGPLFLANPEITWVSDEKATYEEGCLSLPDHYADVVRPAAIRLRYLDRNNERRELEAEGLLATCIQHEIDHLDGVLFVDHVSALKRKMILRKLIKTKKSENKDEWVPKGGAPGGDRGEDSARAL